MASIRVLIVDDHPVVRAGFASIVAATDDIELVGEAADGAEALAMIEHLKPDVLVLDLRMPTFDGLATLRALKDAASRARVLILTASEDKNEYVEAMKLGCCGIVLKSTSTQLLLKSIRKVHAGEIWLDSYTTAAVMRQFASPADIARKDGDGRAPLSQREREIVILVAQGHKNKDIADKLFISEQTVKNHLHNVFDKLKVSDRLELALFAIHTGMHQTAPINNHRRVLPKGSASSPVAISNR